MRILFLMFKETVRQSDVGENAQAKHGFVIPGEHLRNINAVESLARVCF